MVKALKGSDPFNCWAVGGVSSVLSGGKFRSRFLRAGFAKWSGRFTNTMAKGWDLIGASVAGGIGSEIGDGRSQDGAITGAFSRVFNDWGNDGQKSNQYDCGGGAPRTYNNSKIRGVLDNAGRNIPGSGKGTLVVTGGDSHYDKDVVSISDSTGESICLREGSTHKLGIGDDSGSSALNVNQSMIPSLIIKASGGALMVWIDSTGTYTHGNVVYHSDGYFHMIFQVCQ